MLGLLACWPRHVAPCVASRSVHAAGPAPPSAPSPCTQHARWTAHHSAPTGVACLTASPRRAAAAPGCAAPEQLRVKLGLCIRRLKQLWPAGCVTASLLHGNPAARATDGEDLASVASAAAAVPVDAAEGEVDAEGTQRRWAVLNDATGAAGLYS